MITQQSANNECQEGDPYIDVEDQKRRKKNLKKKIKRKQKKILNIDHTLTIDIESLISQFDPRLHFDN